MCSLSKPSQERSKATNSYRKPIQFNCFSEQSDPTFIEKINSPKMGVKQKNLAKNVWRFKNMYNIKDLDAKVSGTNSAYIPV